MKRRSCIAPPLALFLLVLVVSAEAPAETLALTNVNVISMEREGVSRNQVVVVKDGVFSAIGDAGTVTIPAGARIIDAQGGYAIPGLSEMHAHIPGNRDEAEEVLFLYVANGITTARGMLGRPLHLQLRDEAIDGAPYSPRIYTSSPSFNGNTVKNTAQARGKVKQYKKAGYDFLKIHPGLSLKLFDTLDATADEVGIDYAGHVSWQVGVPHALQAGQKTIDHLDGYAQLMVAEEQRLGMPPPKFFGLNLAMWFDESLIPEIARQTAASSTWNVPTQSLFEHTLGPESADELAARPEMQFVNKNTLKDWKESKQNTMSSDLARQNAARMLRARRQLIKALHDAGAGLLLGSDAPQIFNVAGFSIHRELEYLVASGLTPYEALQTGTVNVARFFEAEDTSGTISEGKVADLVLLRGNPLEDISATADIAGVLIRGQWLDESYIKARYYQIAAKYR